MNWVGKNKFDNIVYPDKNIRGAYQVIKTINVYTQFDPIQSVIIGYADENSNTYEQIFAEIGGEHLVSYPPQIISGLIEDQEAIVQKMQEHGVHVVRVGGVDSTQQFEVKGMKVKGFNNLNARDLVFLYHDSLYEFPTPMLSRLKEMTIYEWVEKELSLMGSKISTPNECKLDTLFHKYEKDAYKGDIVFGEAANLLKIGLDIIFLISVSASWGCYKKFRSFMESRYKGKVRVHPVVDVYSGVHIDTTFTVIGYNKKIGKFLVVANGLYVTRQNIPAIFRGKNWCVLELKQFITTNEFPEYCLASPSLALNMSILNSELVLLDQKQTKIIEALQFYGIKCIKVRHRYGRHIGGAFHCMTNQISRKDTFGFQRILETPKQDLKSQQLAGLFDKELLQFLQSKGDIEQWVSICNENKIFATYLTDHLPQNEKEQKLSSISNL